MPDYRENPHETKKLLEELKPGDYVHVKASSVVPSDPHEDGMFKRTNEVLINNIGIIKYRIDKDESRVEGVVISFEDRVYDNSMIGEEPTKETDTIVIYAEHVFVLWDDNNEQQVAKLNNIERISD